MSHAAPGKRQDLYVNGISGAASQPGSQVQIQSTGLLFFKHDEICSVVMVNVRYSSPIDTPEATPATSPVATPVGPPVATTVAATVASTVAA